jgi:hypothetical protein
VEIRGPGGEGLCKVQLLAGFAGVSQSDSLALQAEICWGIVQRGDELVRIEDCP